MNEDDAFKAYMEASQELENMQVEFISKLSEKEFLDMLLRDFNDPTIRAGMRDAIVRESIIQRRIGLGE